MSRILLATRVHGQVKETLTPKATASKTSWQSRVREKRERKSRQKTNTKKEKHTLLT